MAGASCPRCGSRVFRQADELACFSCGTLRAVPSAPLEQGTASRPWSAEEVQYVRARLGVVPMREIAARLGRSPHAVEQLCSRRGWRAGRRVRSPRGPVGEAGSRWTRGEDAALIGWLASSQASKVRPFFSRGEGAARKRLARLGEGPPVSGDGFLSLRQASLEFRVPYRRLVVMLKSGRLTGHRRSPRGPWRLDPGDVERALRPGWRGRGRPRGGGGMRS